MILYQVALSFKKAGDPCSRFSESFRGIRRLGSADKFPVYFTCGE